MGAVQAKTDRPRAKVRMHPVAQLEMTQTPLVLTRFGATPDPADGPQSGSQVRPGQKDQPATPATDQGSDQASGRTADLPPIRPIPGDVPGSVLTCGAAVKAPRSSFPAMPDPIQFPPASISSRSWPNCPRPEDDAKWLSAEVLSTAKSGPAAALLGHDEGSAAAERTLADLRGAAAATASHLRRSLKAISKDRWKGGRFDGRLDDRRAAQIIVGNTEIFRRKVRGEKKSTQRSPS